MEGVRFDSPKYESAGEPKVRELQTLPGIGAHTADDRLLSSLDSFQDIFESYPIQKIFGELLLGSRL